ncbi:MAG: DMT family transporter [Paracoccaceae bacterium]
MIALIYRTPNVLLTLTAIMWAMNAIIGQLVVGEITPFAIVLLRWLMVAAVMWPLYGREVVAHWPALRPRLTFLIVAGVAGFTGFNTLFYVASVYTTGLNVGIIQGAMPAMVLLGAYFAFGDRVGATQIVGVVVTLIGVVLVASGGDAERLAALAFNIGDLLMLAACLLYAVYAVALRKRPNVPGAVLFTVIAIIAAFSALPLAVWEAAQPGYPWPTTKGLALTVIVAIFPSCLAQLFFLRGVDLIGPGRAGVYINLVPIFAAILAILVLGELFAAYHGIALALVIGGIWLAQRKPT